MDTHEKPKILIVDDTPANLLAMRSILEILEVDIVTASSGNEALSLILRQEFAVILLDVQMPDMDGYETAELMLQLEETRFVPIIFVTANDKDEKFVFKGYDVGAVDYIFKPFDPYILKSKVSVFLKLYNQKIEISNKKNKLSEIIREKDRLITEIEEQNQRKDHLLLEIQSQQEQIKRYSKFKFRSILIGLSFLAAISIIYIGYILQKNSQLIAYTEKLNLLNEYTTNLNDACKRFMPYDILNLLNKDSIIDVNLGDQVLKEMIVLFVDVRDYSTIAENLTPEENIKLINEILQIMQEPILEYQGIINKYLGDGLMALFVTNADDALAASIQMLQKMSEYSMQRIGKGLPPIRIGIGIDSGPMMVGTVGSEQRMEHTVIADSVNVSSRIEGMTKIYGASLLISDNVFKDLKDSSYYSIRLMDSVKVKGRNKPVIVYQVLDGECCATIELHKRTMNDFSEGILLFREKKFAEAHQAFSQVLKINQDDVAAKIYKERCEELMKQSIDESWSYVRTLTTK